MSHYKVRVKWGKEKYDGVDLNTAESPMTFKMQLFSLTGVPPDRQKVMIGGVTIGNEDWSKATNKIKENCIFMLMGSAEELPIEPKERPKFIEDMTEEEAASALDLPNGLRNLGNTCYMNATVQCLRAVPELKEQLDDFTIIGSSSDMPHTAQQLASRLSILFSVLEKGDSGVTLIMFLESLHDVVPHFGERDQRTGMFHQQDAHECWSAVVSNLALALEVQKGASDGATPAGKDSFMRQYFGVEFKTTYKCLESEDEMETTEIEKAFQVSCFIEQEVKYLHTGILKGLQGTLEKQSVSLGRDTLYQKNSKISRLPAYLTIQYVRFFYGRSGESEENVSKKILKDVKFPLSLDMFEFCENELQKKLLPVRGKFKDIEDQKMALQAKRIAEGPAAIKQQQQQLPVKYESYSFSDDPGSNNSGYYDLIAVLTHQGRSSSSGHYIGWVKRKQGEWFKYDDDDVSMVTDDEIKKLSGGGDWHTAYILLYAPRRMEILPSSNS